MREAKIKDKKFSKLLLFALLILLSAPFAVWAQYDFTGDGIDELLHVAEDESGLIQWQVLDPTTGVNSTLGYFGDPEDQLAVGNWFQPGQPSIGVISPSSTSTSGTPERFRLRVPLDIVNSSESFIFNLQRGDRASIIASSDLDGNGLSDVAIVRRGHEKRALWHITLNPFDSQSSDKRRITFGSGADNPFTFYFRSGKESLARLNLPRKGNRALSIRHCRLPCKREKRMRISQDYVDPSNLQIQVLRGANKTTGSNNSPRRDSLVFVRETDAGQELTFVNSRGKPERIEAAAKGAAVVVGNFGEGELVEINDGQAQLNNNASGEKIVFTGKVNKPVGNDLIGSVAFSV